LVLFRALLERFKNQELINWTELCGEYEAVLKKDSGIFDQSEFGIKRWKTFKDRVVEHVCSCGFLTKLMINSIIYLTEETFTFLY